MPVSRENGKTIREAQGEIAGQITHGIMNRRLQIDVYRCEVVGGRLRTTRHQRAAWVRPKALAQYALPSPHRRLVATVAPSRGRYPMSSGPGGRSETPTAPAGRQTRKNATALSLIMIRTL